MKNGLSLSLRSSWLIGDWNTLICESVQLRTTLIQQCQGLSWLVGKDADFPQCFLFVIHGDGFRYLIHFPIALEYVDPSVRYPPR